MVRPFQASDASFVLSKLAKIRSDLTLTEDEITKTFSQSNMVAWVKDDDPKIFCSLEYYDVPTGYFPFSGLATQVTHLIGTNVTLDDLKKVLANALDDMGINQPAAKNKPVFARLDPTQVLLFKTAFLANTDATQPRLIYLDKLQTAIARSAGWR